MATVRARWSSPLRLCWRALRRARSAPAAPEPLPRRAADPAVPLGSALPRRSRLAARRRAAAAVQPARRCQRAPMPSGPASTSSAASRATRRSRSWSTAAAKGFQALGVGKGARVGLFLPNCPYYVICFFAVLKAGGTVVNYNPLYADREIARQIEDSRTTIMVTLNIQRALSQDRAAARRHLPRRRSWSARWAACCPGASARCSRCCGARRSPTSPTTSATSSSRC